MLQMINVIVRMIDVSIIRDWRRKKRATVTSVNFNQKRSLLDDGYKD